MSIIESMEKFHAHLDMCKQCRDHPFGLCKVGESLLLTTPKKDALAGVTETLAGTPKGDVGR